MSSRYESRAKNHRKYKQKPGWLKRIFFTVTILALIAGAAYYFLPKLASDELSGYLDKEVEKNGGYEKIREQANANPQVRKFLEEGAQADPDTLPFTTKEEAARVILKKAGPGNLQKVQSMAKDGLNGQEQEELLRMAEDKLSDDEILALKYIANKEINR
ncbi:hypothetical protein CEF21_18755 [Bacillus sp. FJAT-42376]|uniref:hypothetical protein n=1 Tax=Bacillus sp. FJAT-42376 TaxID=2014076 RepID=UPI000F4DE27C|nr:hypothetical protein [Bacillus sp. FJAT-42376]AZB44169.1 hypothetical protein CEF21_18755 [Bacillus sp. FJAT-42376]